MVALLRKISVLLSSCCLSACGLVPPKISEAWDDNFTVQYTGQSGKQEVMLITGSGQIEYEIRKKIFCELKYAVIAEQEIRVTDDGKNPTKPIPDDWIVHVSIGLTVEESSSLSPGVSLKSPIHSEVTHFAGEVSGTALSSGAGYGFLTTPQSYSLGLGGTLSSTSTRIDRFDPYYTIQNLQTPTNGIHVCDYMKSDESQRADSIARANSGKDQNDYFSQASHGQFTPATSSPLIYSNLGIKEWLNDSIFAGRSLPSHIEVPKKKPVTRESLSKERMDLGKQGYTTAEVTQIIAAKAGASGGGGTSGVGTATKPDTISLELKFVVVTNGNVTPTWNLVRVGTPNSPLFAAGRTRTHDLLITIGPPNNDTAYSHLASLIGQAVANQVRAP